MSLRMSLDEFRALRVRPGQVAAAAALAGAPPQARTAARAALDAALAPRKAAKGGRLPRIEGAATDEISFVVEHDPRTKARARTQMSKTAIEQAFFRSRGDINAFRRMLAEIPHRSFTPKSTGDFERAVSESATRAMAGRLPFHGPVEIDVRFVFEGDDGRWPTDVTDADLDNLEKAILDGLNKVAYTDDRLVVRKTGEKVCGPGGRVDVTIRALPAPPRPEPEADKGKPRKGATAAPAPSAGRRRSPVAA